jgi:hypothetical protein
LERHEIEYLRRSIAVLQPATTDAAGREQAIQLFAELRDVQGRLETLKARLRDLAEEP